MNLYLLLFLTFSLKCKVYTEKDESLKYVIQWIIKNEVPKQPQLLSGSFQPLPHS